MKILRATAIAAVLSTLIAVVGPSTALAYDFPSTNDANQMHGDPYVAETASGAGWVTLAFYNPHSYGAFFEYRVDGHVLTSGTAHSVVDGDVIYPGVGLANSGSSPTYKTFYAYETVEVRLALGAERDTDFDWTTFDVPSPTNCIFDTVNTTMTLTSDCTTTATIFVPDGYTLNGNGHTITALDPTGSHFLGAVIQNAGASMNVVDLTVTANGLANVCDPATPVDTRLRGILLNGASGTIAHNIVVGINQGPSGCQEGNAIEARNAPFDGSGTNPLSVEIAHNVIDDYQKTGIVANGNMTANIHHNQVGDSAIQANLAANGIQLGFGASGSITQNQVDGNQWLGNSDDVATAILVYASGGADVSKNNIRGNAEIGIYVYADNVTVDNNKVFDDGKDSACHLDCTVSYDIGIGSYGDNTLTNNKVRGFDTPYDGLDDLGTNKVVGQPAN